jgi:cation diffusion facilitator CzcD-associated flavoprotein CzcO
VLPERVAHPAVRWKNALIAMATYQLSRRRPDLVKSFLSKGAAKQLPEGYDVAAHFSPAYEPWDQRVCVVPDGDLFTAVRGGRAEIVTDRIETLTKTGVKLASGAELDADIVVTATGLNLLPIGGLGLAVDGAPVELAETVAYKGMMLSGVPNFALAIGYTNASWTLKCDLVAHYVCRLLNHMDAHGYRVCTPKAPELEDGQTLDPLIDLQSGYVQRSVDKLPRQGPAAPWRLHQNYPRDVVMLRHRSVADKGVEFA